MQVSVEASEGIQRRLRVHIPEGDLEQRVDNRIRELSQRTRVDGFRPGKVPLRVARQRFGDQAQREALETLLRTGVDEALKQQEASPVGTPSIEGLNVESGKPVEFTVVFETYPVIEVGDPTQIEITVPESEITPEDVAEALGYLRKRHGHWQPANDRPAEWNDRLTVDYRVFREGEHLEEEDAEGSVIELGAQSSLAELETALVGATTGESKTIETSFPEQHSNTRVAGRNVQFEVRINRIERPPSSENPRTDEAVRQALGLGADNTESLEAILQRQMEQDLQRRLKDQMRKQVMDALVAHYPIPVPNALVDEEMGRLRENLSQNGLNEDHESDAITQAIRGEAERRVARGLILSELIRHQGIEADQARIDTIVERVAQDYDDPESAARHVRSDREAMTNLRIIATEEAMVEWLLTNARVTRQSVRYQDLVTGA